MRQTRAPTQSQIQNPPAPVSTTKTGRIFGKSNFGVYCPSTPRLVEHLDGGLGAWTQSHQLEDPWYPRCRCASFGEDKG